MWIVRLALRRPYTFVVMAISIVLIGVLTILRMATDIYPMINIPVVAAVWSYTGLAPEEMEARVTTQFERAVTTTVNAIEHLESQSLAGVSVVKVYLQPGSSVVSGLAQVSAAAEPILRSLPPGATPPGILQYSASDTAILQLALSSATLPEQQIYDLATNFLRPRLATVRGAQLPLPYGGLFREVVIDLDPEKLFAWGLSPSDVSAALGKQNLIIPSGTAKIGLQEYPILINASPTAVAQFNDLPILVRSSPSATGGGTTVYLRDVSHVRDGYAPQTNVVVIDGAKGALLPVLKAQDASTLDVVSQTRATLPAALSTLPPDFHVAPLFDQSLFVRGAVSGVVREAAIAAGLTALMMLAFLGSWRSTLIVLTSIPLALLVSIIALNTAGQTINLMTLGGMALAVGILVDDATVEIENVHRQRATGKPLVRAILDGAAEIAAPAFVSTVCICITFLPVTLVGGAAKSLFIPLAMAVVFAMLTSYFLSRTLVPTMCRYLLGSEPGTRRQDAGGPIAWVHRQVEGAFEGLRDVHRRALDFTLSRRKTFVTLFAVFVLLSLALVPLLGQDFFPSVDAGQNAFARPRPAWPAHRGDAEALRTSRGARTAHRSAG
jgi:multidrug efflux pump subunit AcrB